MNDATPSSKNQTLTATEVMENIGGQMSEAPEYMAGGNKDHYPQQLCLSGEEWAVLKAEWDRLTRNAVETSSNAGVKCTHCNGTGNFEAYYDEDSGWMEESPCTTCGGSGRIRTVEQYLKTLPANWHEDSSVQTWFPILNEEVERLRRAEQECLKSHLGPRPDCQCGCYSGGCGRPEGCLCDRTCPCGASGQKATVDVCPKCEGTRTAPNMTPRDGAIRVCRDSYHDQKASTSQTEECPVCGEWYERNNVDAVQHVCSGQNGSVPQEQS